MADECQGTQRWARLNAHLGFLALNREWATPSWVPKMRTISRRHFDRQWGSRHAAGAWAWSRAGRLRSQFACGRRGSLGIRLGMDFNRLICAVHDFNRLTVEEQAVFFDLDLAISRKQADRRGATCARSADP